MFFVIFQSAVGSELRFILPRDSKRNFENLFVDLEQNSDKLGVNAFGVSVTTMEEVFMKYLDSLRASVTVCFQLSDFPSIFRVSESDSNEWRPTYRSLERRDSSDSSQENSIATRSGELLVTTVH